MTKREEKAQWRHADPLLRALRELAEVANPMLLAMRRELAQANAIIRRVSGRHATSPVTR